MDMYNNRSAVHKALTTITEYDKEMIKGMAGAKPAGLVWDYLWGSYSCLGDQEYDEFEGQYKYAGSLNEMTAKEGMAFCVHNCADLPHLDTQIKKMKPAIYSMAYYPLIPAGIRTLEPREDAEDHHEPVPRGQDRPVRPWSELQVLHRFRMRSAPVGHHPP
jgi:uroporphyrinogen-III decarboxylase